MSQPEVIRNGDSIKEQDEESIIQLIKAIDETWNNRDAEAFAGLFQANADFQFNTGRRIQGKASIEKFWGQEVFPGMSDRLRHIGTPERIRFINKNVAICDGTLRIVARATEEESEQVHLDTHGTVVVVKQHGTWLVSAIRLISFLERNRSD